MRKSSDADLSGPEPQGPSRWVSTDARHNGLPAVRWAEIITVSPTHADELLTAFRAAGVPACAAPAHQSWIGDPHDRVWVDASRYAAAEDVLLRQISSGSPPRVAASSSGTDPTPAA